MTEVASLSHERKTPGPRRLRGVIVSDKMHETAVVLFEREYLHPRVKKHVTVRQRFKAHNAGNEYHAGESVIIEESRPLSRDKRWRIVGKARSV